MEPNRPDRPKDTNGSKSLPEELFVLRAHEAFLKKNSFLSKKIVFFQNKFVFFQKKIVFFQKKIVFFQNSELQGDEKKTVSERC
jgi:hypothetical protein